VRPGRCHPQYKDITTYFSRLDSLSPSEPEIEAEIALSWENRGKKDEIAKNIETFLRHGDERCRNGEPMPVEFHDDAHRISLSSADQELGRPRGRPSTGIGVQQPPD
jgi:hypothetical protein